MEPASRASHRSLVQSLSPVCRTSENYVSAEAPNHDCRRRQNSGRYIKSNRKCRSIDGTAPSAAKPCEHVSPRRSPGFVKVLDNAGITRPASATSLSGLNVLSPCCQFVPKRREIVPPEHSVGPSRTDGVNTMVGAYVRIALRQTCKESMGLDRTHTPNEDAGELTNFKETRWSLAVAESKQNPTSSWWIERRVGRHEPS